MNTKVDEGKLISGKEALIALANGEGVQYWSESDPSIQKRWTTIKSLDEYKLSYFLDEKTKFKFRIKPRTITINGIELPAPFKPNIGDIHFYLNFGRPELYARKRFDGNYCDTSAIELGAWRTEEEAQQVVAALRQVFGGSHDN